MTWGDPEWGGDSSAVQDQLRKVQQIEATDGAFAANLADESVVTSGIPEAGGDSSDVQDRLAQCSKCPRDLRLNALADKWNAQPIQIPQLIQTLY